MDASVFAALKATGFFGSLLVLGVLVVYFYRRAVQRGQLDVQRDVAEGALSAERKEVERRDRYLACASAIDQAASRLRAAARTDPRRLFDPLGSDPPRAADSLPRGADTASGPRSGPSAGRPGPHQ